VALRSKRGGVASGASPPGSSTRRETFRIPWSRRQRARVSSDDAARVGSPEARMATPSPPCSEKRQATVVKRKSGPSRARAAAAVKILLTEAGFRGSSAR